MKLRLLRDFLPRPLPLKIFIPRSIGHSADTSDPSTNQDREAGRNSERAEHSNPAPIGHFYRFLCRAEKVLARLFEVLVLGKTNMKIGRGILHEITSDQTLAHVCRVFWGTTITAHLDAAQMAAFKLFDSRSGSMTVKYALDLANQCSDSFQKATPIQVQSIIDAARAKIDK